MNTNLVEKTQYKIKPVPLGQHFRGKWSLTLVRQVVSGPLFQEQWLYFGEIFDGREEAEDYGQWWVSARARLFMA